MPTITSLDTWVVCTRPSGATRCVPTVCALTVHAPAVTWHFDTTFLQAQMDKPEGTVDWTLRGRKGKPVRVVCLQTPRTARDTVSLPEWPSNAMCMGAGGCQSIPYLKSHLQKCVRKGLDLQAVATTKQLLKLSVVECVRRLAIIMVEDVALHPQAMGVLLWWTIVLAHRIKGRDKGAKLSCVDVPLWFCEWVLGLVHVLCAHPVHVRLPNTLPHMTPWQRLQTFDKTHTSVTSSHRDLLCSLYLRATYGGLKGDVALLEQAAEAVFHNETAMLITTPIQPIVWDSVGALPMHAWDLDAIDFHVVPRLFELVERGDKTHDRPLIDTSLEEESTDAAFDWKRMMWENASMTNIRLCVEMDEKMVVREADNEAHKKLYGCTVWADWQPRVRPLQQWLVRMSYGR